MHFLRATLVSQAQFSLSFDPEPTSIPGWSLDRKLYHEYVRKVYNYTIYKYILYIILYITAHNFLLQQITEDMIDYFKIFIESGLEKLEWLENDFLFPPRYQLEFKLRDLSIASNTIIIKVIGTEPAVEMTILLENPSQYNVIHCVIYIEWLVQTKLL